MHPRFFFNLQLTERAEISEQKDEQKTKKTHSHPSFFILQLPGMLISLR